MVIFETFRNIFETIIAPFQTLFDMFPAFGTAFGTLLFLTLSYYGWRAIK